MCRRAKESQLSGVQCHSHGVLPRVSEGAWRRSLSLTRSSGEGVKGGREAARSALDAESDLVDCKSTGADHSPDQLVAGASVRGGVADGWWAGKRMNTPRGLYLRVAVRDVESGSPAGARPRVIFGWE